MAVLKWERREEQRYDNQNVLASITGPGYEIAFTNLPEKFFDILFTFSCS